MDYNVKLSLLSKDFEKDYPIKIYSELMYKQGRPYSCLLIKSIGGYYVCVPFRSHIAHKNAYMFIGTKRSIQTKSGLDYSKIVIIDDNKYFDSSTPALVDNDEFTEMMNNITDIVKDVKKYVSEYIDHFNGTKKMHMKKFNRNYKYSTLKYFHKELGINEHTKDEN